ncbi:MAG: pyruvate dehydrogenase complex dihydrolipoamide acetyltransferase [Ignavibacteriales bacterium]|nr:pyruvate dehydrogenase complex dihydrolipoamide acetyltransferase [Ignavibacteriales bacterium]
MATKMLMPKLSDTMEEGVILKWRKKEGEKVKAGEIIADIQSDKADMEQEAYDSGVLLKIFPKEGDGVKVGAPLVIIGKEGEDISALLAESTSAAPATLKQESVSVAAAPSIIPVPASVPTPAAVPVVNGDTRLRLEADSGGQTRIKASPLAKKIAQEKNIDLRTVSGSGPFGRIVKADVESRSGTTTMPRKVLAPLQTKEIPLSMMRKTIAKRLLESKVTIPHFYLTIEMNMRRAIDFRSSLIEITGTKISYNDIVMKAVALALRENPKANSSFMGDKIVQHGRVDVSVAVAIDEGLITPVIRNADQKTIAEISTETKELAKRAREGKLKPEEFTNGTFTVSNLGMYDIENFAAIINPPEGAILAVGTIVEKPVVENGQIVVGHTMKVTMSCDHRVVDGAIGAQFLQSFKRLMENPLVLVL